MKAVSVLPLLFCVAYSAPSVRVLTDQTQPQLLTLPSNATSIRADINDSFHCDGREYGYYADVDNDCQLFHVCLPITFPTGRIQTFRWSFICPDDTVFNQEIFTCTRSDESIDCADSPRYYNLNTSFGEIEETGHQDIEEIPERPADVPAVAEVPQALEPERKPEITRRTSKF